MAEHISVKEAEANFSEILDRVEAGEDIAIEREDHLAVKLTPLPKKGGVRGRGSLKGKIWMVSDEEMKKVDEEITELIEESEIFPGENLPADRE